MSDKYLELPSVKKMLELRKDILENKSTHEKNIVNLLEKYFNETLVFISFYGLEEIRIYLNFFVNFIFDYFKKELMLCQQSLVMQFIKLLDYYPHLYKLELDKEQMDLIDYLNIEIRQIDDMTLTSKQVDLYRNILRKNQVIYSAPTSYGKTMLCLNGFFELLKLDEVNNLLIIVPTKALINDYKKNIKTFITKNKIEAKVIESAYAEFDLNQKNIYVFTQERVLAFFNISERINSINYILVDEAQAIASLKNKRTPILLKALSLFDNCPKIYLTPFVKNFNTNIIKNIDTNNTFDECVVTGKESLVSNNKFIIDIYNEQDITIYDVTFNKYDEYMKFNRKYDKTMKKADFLNLKSLIEEVTSRFGKTIIFTTNKENSMDWPKDLLKDCQPIILSKRMKALIKHLEENIHPDFLLIDFLKHGIAFHNNYLDNYTKRQIEYIFTEEESIKYLFCTTTISQGVNFSAKNIFAFVGNFKSENPELEFVNLLGRAARLKYNGIGNLFFVKTTKTTKYENVFLNSNDNLNIELSEIKESDIKKNENIELRSYLADTNIKNNFKDNIYLNNDLIIQQLGIVQTTVDQMNYSIEQSDVIKIENEIFNLSKEKLEKYIKFYQSYETTKEFIGFLKQIYNWEKIYSNAQQKNKRILNIEFISTIITKLVQGDTINAIVNYNISRSLFINVEYKTVSREMRYGYVPFQYNNIEHINIIITNSLFDVQNIIEFDVKKYIQDFYYRVNKINNIRYTDKNLENFIDFSTIDNRKVALMNIGLVDTFAINEIVKNKEYVEIINNETIDLNSLFDKIIELEGDESPIYYAVKDII